MKVIFGTTNKRKIEDLQNMINELILDLEILDLDDIKWDQGDIEETGNSIEENSLIKAQNIFMFCKNKLIKYPIITDDAGLFCEALNQEPGVYTARYADDELKLNPELQKYQCVIKLLKKLNGVENRNATYKCCVTCMMPDGTYFQEFGESNGIIADKIIGELMRPYFYSVFIIKKYNKVFSKLNEYELKDTYRYTALRKTLNKLNKEVR